MENEVKFWESVQAKARAKNNHEIQIIETIKRHRKVGRSYAWIATLLNMKGYPTKEGKQWSSPTVRNILERLSPDFE